MNKKLKKNLIIISALIINLFRPGLGNVLLGQFKIGFLFLFYTFLSFILGLKIIQIPNINSNFGVVLLLSCIIVGIFSSIYLLLNWNKIEEKSNIGVIINFLVLLFLLATPSMEERILDYYRVSINRLKGISMNPTLVSGEVVLVNKQDVYTRGDIVMVNVTMPNDSIKKMGKRVIAFEGELIRIKDGKIYIDGKEILESRIKKITYRNLGESKYGVWENYRIPKGYVYILGDNSSSSYDSRYFGAIPMENLQGIYLKTIWPIKRVRDLNDE